MPQRDAKPPTGTRESAAVAGRTRPMAATPSPDVSPPVEAAGHAQAAAVADDPAPPTPAPARAVAVTAALPQVPEAIADEPHAEKPAPSVESKPSVQSKPPSRLRPIDIVLIICTFGVYGVVLWIKQRKPAA